MQREQDKDNEAIHFFLTWWGQWGKESNKSIWTENARHVLRLDELGYVQAMNVFGVSYRGILTPLGEAFINLAGGLAK